jgi:purine nucleoside phosphorylase
MDVDAAVPYADIPHFVPSTVEGHKGNFVLGTLGGAPIVFITMRATRCRTSPFRCASCARWAWKS